ncbi:MAG: M1 family metallopeptidase [Chloroflexi bacterium]|nr:M1 family metallopeptidase [Chloroflexota bacterium]
MPAFLGDLDQAADATRYDIDLKLNADLQHLEGTQTIHYVNRSTTAMQEVMLRLYPNTDYLGGQMHVFDVRADGAAVEPLAFLRPSQGLTLTSTTPLTDTSLITVPLPQALAPGQVTTLTLNFTLTAQLHTNSGYRTFGWADRILALPEAYAMAPVHDESGWHVDALPSYGDIAYSDISLYRVRILAPADMVIVATGVCTQAPVSAAQLTTPTESPPAWVVTTCEAGPVRDFAIHASQVFQVVTATVAANSGNVVVSSYYMPEQKLGGQRALDYASAALLDFERRFGPYPYKELKVFPSATTAGGIEYPMLAGVLDTLYSTDPASLEWIVVHEVSHQWWYGMVGSDQVNEPWLDEALAQYSTSLYIEDRYGRAIADAQRNERFLVRYQQELKTGRDAPVDQPTAAFDRSMYFPIIYGKGPLFFDSVRRAVTDLQFDAWLKTYFMRYRFKIAHRDDLLNLADEMGIGAPVRMAFDQWMRRLYVH